MTETGRLGAFITKVKKGSLADVVGHLRAGEREFWEMAAPPITLASAAVASIWKKNSRKMSYGLLCYFLP